MNAITQRAVCQFAERCCCCCCCCCFCCHWHSEMQKFALFAGHRPKLKAARGECVAIHIKNWIESKRIELNTIQIVTLILAQYIPYTHAHPHKRMHSLYTHTHTHYAQLSNESNKLDVFIHCISCWYSTNAIVTFTEHSQTFPPSE